MTRHIRADKLASYRAGDLGTRKSARVRAHLGGCARCTAAADDLAAVSTFLASVPAPPMPDDITARIEAALAAEAASRAASPAVPAARGAAPVAPGRDGAGRRAAVRSPRNTRSGGWLRSPVTLRVAAGAAVAAVILGGGFAAIRLAGSAGTSGTSGSASSAENSTSSGSGAGAAAQGSREAPAAARPAPTLTYRAGGQPRPFTVLTSSANLGPGNLGREIGQLVPGVEGTTEPASASPAPTALGRQPGGIPGFAPAALEACVTRVADGGQVKLVTIGRYQGQRAAIIVVSPAGGGPAQIWVVGTGCSATSSDVITQMALPGSG